MSRIFFNPGDNGHLQREPNHGRQPLVEVQHYQQPHQRQQQLVIEKVAATVTRDGTVPKLEVFVASRTDSNQESVPTVRKVRFEGHRVFRLGPEVAAEEERAPGESGGGGGRENNEAAYKAARRLAIVMAIFVYHTLSAGRRQLSNAAHFGNAGDQIQAYRYELDDDSAGFIRDITEELETANQNTNKTVEEGNNEAA